MNTLHLFAGAGGGLLCDLILGHTPIGAVEIDPYCCRVLRERAADGWFPDLCVHEGDVRLFDPSKYAGRVGCLHAGFPCQDISLAGSRAGVGPETRSGLYREVLRCAGVVRPRYLFLENVAAIISAADKQFIAFFEKCIQLDIFGAANPESIAGRYIRRVIEIRLQAAIGTVLGDLAALGYDAEWLCLRASDCGAPHRRDRWWCLARNTDDSDDGEITGICSGENTIPGGICDVANPQEQRLQNRHAGSVQGRPITERQTIKPERCGIDVADSMRGGHGQPVQSIDQRRSGVEADAGGDGEIQYVADAHQHARHEGRPGDAAQEPRGRHADRGGERACIPGAILERPEGQREAGAATPPAHGPGHGRDTDGRKTESGLG